MKIARWIIAVAALAFMFPTLTQEAPAAATDQIFIIYRASGVKDNSGAPNGGVATSVHCTNTSAVSERLNIVVRDSVGNIRATATFTLDSFHTFTASTHETVLFSDAAGALNTGNISQGFFSIGSTTTNMFCSAMIMDAASAGAVGIPLHLVRYNSAPGTIE
jgi:hypothetical protein